MGRGVKSLVAGGGVNSMILILPITKIFDKIYACILGVWIRISIFYLFCQQSCKNRMFLYDF